jgi:DNA-binding NtrC family response regulator
MKTQNDVNILVIDDEISIGNLFRRLFIKYRYRVSIANNGLEGLEFVKRSFYDLIFLDIMMPKMNGAETFFNIKKIKPEIPVIIISSSGEYELEEIAKSYGPYAFIYKPFNIDEILKLTQTILKNKGILDNNNVI